MPQPSSSGSGMQSSEGERMSDADVSTARVPATQAGTLPVGPPSAARDLSASRLLAALNGSAKPAPLGWAIKGLFIIALLALLRAAQPLLLPILVSVILAFVLWPLARRCRGLGLSESAAAGVVVLLLLGTMAGLVSAVARPAAEWWERAPNDLQQLQRSWERLRASVPLLRQPPPAVQQQSRAGTRSAAAAPSVQTVQAPVPPPATDTLSDRLTTEGLMLTRTVLVQFAHIVLSAVATVILLYFLLASERWLLKRVVSAMADRRSRARLLAAVRGAQRDIARYFGTYALINIGLGIATGIAMSIIGLPNPTFWGVLVGTLNFIPYLGPFIASVALLLAGVITFDAFAQMITPMLVFIALNMTEAYVVSPLVVGRSLATSPLAVFLAVMLWGWLWGMGGAIVAVPILLILRSVCRRTRALKTWCLFLDRSEEKLPKLAALLQRRPSSAATSRTPRTAL